MGGHRLHPGERRTRPVRRAPDHHPRHPAFLLDRADGLRRGQSHRGSGLLLPRPRRSPHRPGRLRRATRPDGAVASQHRLPRRSPTQAGLRTLRRDGRCRGRRRPPHRRSPDGLVQLALVPLRQCAHRRYRFPHRAAWPADLEIAARRAGLLRPARPRPGLRRLLQRRLRPRPRRADLVDIGDDDRVVERRRRPGRGVPAPRARRNRPHPAVVDRLPAGARRLLRRRRHRRRRADGRRRLPHVLPAEPLRLLAPAHRHRLPAHDRRSRGNGAAGRPVPAPPSGHPRRAAPGHCHRGRGLPDAVTDRDHLDVRRRSRSGDHRARYRHRVHHAGRHQHRNTGRARPPRRPGLGRRDRRPADRRLPRGGPAGHLFHLTGR